MINIPQKLFFSTVTGPLNTKRPLSPYISIYQPQLTWLMSIGHRLTGSATAFGFYATLISFGLFGPQGTSQNIAIINEGKRIIKEAPLSMVILAKAAITAPISFHYWNGIRHLIWDTGFGLSLKGVYGSGWAVNVATLLCTGYFSLV